MRHSVIKRGFAKGIGNFGQVPNRSQTLQDSSLNNNKGAEKKRGNVFRQKNHEQTETVEVDLSNLL